MPRSLRWHITILYVVAVVLVVAAATAYAIVDGSARLRDASIEKQAGSTEGAASAVALFLDAAGRSLASAASQVPEAALKPEIDEDEVGVVLDPVVAYAGSFEAVLLVDAMGDVRLARPVGAWPGGAFAGSAALERAIEGSPALHLAGEGDAYWAVPVPASRGSADVLAVVGVFDRARLEGVLFANVPADTQARILDAAGAIVASTEPLATPRTDERIVTASLAGPYPASVQLARPPTEILALRAQLVQNAILTGAGLIAAALVVGIVSTKRIARPLAAVRDASHRMRTGDLTARAPVGGAQELRELATDFNAMAAALAKERDELLALERHLEALVAQRTAQLEDKRKDMELFFYGVSHDLKSPVSAISAFTQMAQEAVARDLPDRSELAECLVHVSRASDNLATILQELLKFAQAERGKPAYSEADLASVVRAVVDEATPAAAAKAVELAGTGPSIPLRTDPARVRHIVTNLVQNAIKYMPRKEGAWVRVTWEQREGEARVAVSDNGAGIPPEVLAKLFRPFTRHVPPGVEASGTGLGLAVVRAFAESLGASVEVASEEGRGSTFTLRLPLAPPEPG